MSCSVNSLNVPQTVFCLFYAIFWGLVANAQIRWKAFDWPLAIDGCHKSTHRPSLERIKRSVVYLTAVPIVLFLLLVSMLAYTSSREFSFYFIVQLLGAIVAAHAAFAPYRLWLADMEGDPKRFFYPVDSEAKEEAGEYTSQPWLSEKLRLDPQWSKKNRCVGYGYVGVGLVGAGVAMIFG